MTHYFFSGIGGSGMLPLCLILKGQGHSVSGSDRAYDQGRTPEKFENLKNQGITLYPQDGSGIAAQPDYLVVSSAIEDTVPDVAAAKAANIAIIKRANLLAELFNVAPHSIAVGGTSGKTTITGMIGTILKEAGYNPTLMCGGTLKNYNASALVGDGDVFVTEADESDGSIALYAPEIAVLTNISLDHKSMDELIPLFTNFVAGCHSVINIDNMASAALIGPNTLTYGLHEGDIHASDIFSMDDGTSAIIHYKGQKAAISLELLGEHNLSNALAAIGACVLYGLGLDVCCDALSRFHGIKRRLEYVGDAQGITVYDDFAHNPDKIAASLKALHNPEGRLLVIFQMHGYGPLKLMMDPLASTFAAHLGPDDKLFMPDPLYLGGTADKSVGTLALATKIGPQAMHCQTRELCAAEALALAQPGDRIVVMGARDDSLSDFAADVLQTIIKTKA